MKKSSKPQPRKTPDQAKLVQILERLAQGVERLAQAAERLVALKLPQPQQRGVQEPKTIAESAAAAKSAREDAADTNEEQ